MIVLQARMVLQHALWAWDALCRTCPRTRDERAQGSVILVRQKDQPGIIAGVSRILGEADVNISFMTVRASASLAQCRHQQVAAAASCAHCTGWCSCCLSLKMTSLAWRDILAISPTSNERLAYAAQSIHGRHQLWTLRTFRTLKTRLPTPRIHGTWYEAAYPCFCKRETVTVAGVAGVPWW